MVHAAFEPFIRQARENPEPLPSSVSADERRRTFRREAAAVRGELAPMALVEDRQLELEGRTLGARLYVPLDEETSALIIYFHGGCFVLGDLETHDWLCRRLAFDTDVRLLAIDYRLAPEHPFPAALDDATDVVRHVAAHPEEFGARTASIIMMGDSAGANLVTVAATQLRDEELGIAAQVLIYPTLGPELVTDSANRFGTGYLMDLESLRHDYALYLDGFVDHTDPRVTPLLCTDLSRVAPAVVVVAECDPLRDEGVAYAGLLGHFGVPVELLEAEDMVHGFLELGGVVPEALEILDDLASHVHRLVEAAS
ncbi:MAG: alpha/beta hydrolase [Acidimicrobiales bacterium]